MKKIKLFTILSLICLTSCTLPSFDSLKDIIASEFFSEETSSESSNKISSEIITSYDPNTADVSIHFLELGNKFTGDSVYIKVDDIDILIDAGSRTSSSPFLINYIDQYCIDKKLEFVIATHAHQDHIAGFINSSSTTGLLDYYKCDTIIDFAKTNTNSDTYQKYIELVNKQVENGAKHFNALECYNNSKEGAQRSYDLGKNVSLNILYQKYYETNSSSENNYSVCTLLSQGNDHYLFTGDLEKAGEKSLVESNNLPHVKVYKGGHHGSGTSSCDELLDVITPENICICTCCGTPEYAQTFPYQETIDRMAKHTDKIYCTTQIDEDNPPATGFNVKPMNGTIIVRSNVNGFSIEGTNNSTILKDTDWFKKHRTWPSN